MIGVSPEQAYCDSAKNRGWQSSKQVDADNTNSAASKGEDQKRVVNRALEVKERSAQVAMNLIHGRWKTRILSRLQHGPTRLSELRRMFPEASKKMLAQHLRELEKDRLVIRTDLSGRVRHIEYSLSHSLGFAALHLIGTPAGWGREYLPRMVSEPYSCCGACRIVNSITKSDMRRRTIIFYTRLDLVFVEVRDENSGTTAARK